MFYTFNFRWALLALCAFCVLFFYGLRIFNITSFVVNTVASTITYPFLKIQNGIATNIEHMLLKRASLQELKQKVKQLEVQQEQLLQENISLQSKLDFVQETKELVQFQKRYKTYTKHLCQILLRQCCDKGHFIIVDAGSRHGVELDMIAVYKNCLVGKVTEVFPFYAKVMLISDHNFKIAAFCAQTKTKGIFEGINRTDTAALSHVSHLEKICNDDLVISSGEGLIFPRGFGLGRIRVFSVDGVDYTIRLEPLISVASLSYCYLMKKGFESAAIQEVV